MWDVRWAPTKVYRRRGAELKVSGRADGLLSPQILPEPELPTTFILLTAAGSR